MQVNWSAEVRMRSGPESVRIRTPSGSRWVPKCDEDVVV